MITRSKSNVVSGMEGSHKSTSSAATRARILAAEAAHERRLADLQKEALASERRVAEAEYRAEIAELEAVSCASSTSHRSRVAEWLDQQPHPDLDHATSTFAPLPSQAPAGMLDVSQNTPHVQATDQQTTVGPSGPMRLGNVTSTFAPLPSQVPAGMLDGTPNAVPSAGSLSHRLREPVHNQHVNFEPLLQNEPARAFASASIIAHPANVPATHILSLAEAISNIATRASPKTEKMSKGLPLPIFDGQPADWLIFKKMYDETFLSFSASDNLARINAALRGPARESVSVLLPAAHDPAEVIRALEVTFARPEHIILNELSKIRLLPRLTNTESSKELNSFSSRVNNCVGIVKLLNRAEYLASPELANEIVGKFTPLLRSRWADFAKSKESAVPNLFRLELLAEFLSHEAEIRTKYDFFAISAARSDGRDVRDGKFKNVSCHIASVNETVSHVIETCLFCGEKTHNIRSCKKFRDINIDERWDWISANKVCYKCLAKSHNFRRCRKFCCKVKACSYKFNHHTLLHRDKQEKVEQIVANGSPTETVAHNFLPVAPVKSLLKVIPVTVSGPEGNLEIFALLDDGSTATLMDSSVSKALGIDGRKAQLRVAGVGGMTTDINVTYVSVGIKGRHSSHSFHLKNVRSMSNLDLSSQTVRSRDISSFGYLADLIPVLSYDNVKPLLLIGVDNWNLTVPLEIRRGSPSEPIATRTMLGWVLYGTLKQVSSSALAVHHCTVEDSLDQQLREYFRLESIGISKQEYLSEEDKRAIEILKQTTRKLPSGRFETGLLWKADDVNFPDSLALARSRFLSLEKKMQQDQVYGDAYRAFIRTILDKGYAEMCDEIQPNHKKVWYLPHFGVLHPQKRKLRVVHDAAAKSKGVSLNSLLLSGPDLLQPALAILMRFREGAVALNADIREMYPQTKIRTADRDAQRFLWRDYPNENLKCLRMSSLIFGATSSPFTAMYLKNLNAEEHRVSYPAAVRAIIDDHYMDDFLGSVDSVKEAASLAADIVHIHSQACLEMRAWVSNSEEALSLLPRELLAETDGSKSTVRVLGVAWKVIEDSLLFPAFKFIDIPKKLTKRGTLSYLMSIYDPLGLLIPIIIKGRVIFQQTWKLAVDWDQELPPNIKAKWNSWFQDMATLSAGTIPRHYLTGKRAVSRELHVFADASEAAFACVAYWRFTCTDSSVQLALVGGKARLSPLKPVSIPRLELQAALIAARFADYVIKAHRQKPSKVHFWSDSQTVLKWIRSSDARAFKPFVAHRIGEILEITSASDWRYVPTAFNVADDATRTNHIFTTSSRWFSGPPFLFLSESEWPREPSPLPKPDLSEMKRGSSSSEMVCATNTHSLPSPVVADPSRFSEWLRLVRATARIFQCAKVFKALLFSSASNANVQTRVSSSRTPTLLAAEDLLQAEQQLFLQSQLDSFKDDYALLKRGEPQSKTGRLKNISLYVDHLGLLRLRGRIQLLDGVEIEKDPIVLDGKHRIVRLLIASYHKKAAHGNNETVVNLLRQEFFILRVRPAVKSVASQCLMCRIRKAQPISPAVGDLPRERLAHHMKPFTHVGLDYFGPVTVTVRRRTEKRYVALFTCLTVRAVHLEIVASLSTDSAIMAIRRFVSRRGTPQTIYSDNGTAFIGASRELQILFETPVQEFACNQKICWKFIPPAAPFMGGCWERLVKSIKSALRVTLKERSPKEEIFSTLILEAEALVNSRPLTHVPVEPQDEEALTPFHFLIGCATPYSTFARVNDDDFIHRVSWRKGLRLADHFWARWTREYLPTLIPRSPTANGRNVKVGDCVLIVDGALPRGVWPRGRVVNVLPGRDGAVRVVDVETRCGILRRPVKKVALLPA